MLNEPWGIALENPEGQITTQIFISPMTSEILFALQTKTELEFFSQFDLNVLLPGGHASSVCCVSVMVGYFPDFSLVNINAEQVLGKLGVFKFISVSGKITMFRPSFQQIWTHRAYLWVWFWFHKMSPPPQKGPKKQKCKIGNCCPKQSDTDWMGNRVYCPSPQICVGFLSGNNYDNTIPRKYVQNQSWDLMSRFWFFV